MKLSTQEKKTATATANKKRKAAASQVSANKPGAYRLEATPRGKALFTYFLACLTNLGGFTVSRKVMDKKTLTSYFASPSCVTHHVKCGNIESTATGIRLTVSGWNYFGGRLTGSVVGQEVDAKEMKALAAALKTGKLATKTERFPVTTKFIALKS